MRLMLVEDEPALAALLEKYLVRLGYQIQVCLRAEEALRSFRQDPASYALVLADLTLEGISGEELLDQMLDLNPRLIAVLASGYSYQPRSPRIHFFQKPFSPKALAGLLDGAATRSAGV